MWIRQVRKGTVCDLKLIRVNFIEKMTFKQRFEEDKQIST